MSRNRKRKLTGANSVTMWLDVGDLNSLLDDLGDAVSDSVRPAAQAGAQVFYDRAKQYVGAMGRVTGNLSSAIYQAYSESNSGQDKATYHVSWNHIKAPHGQLLEYGHWQRYQVILTSKGWKTMTRPGKMGTPKPSRRASQEAKDAYYVPRAGGPVYIPGKHFMGRATQAAPEAEAAMSKVLMEAIDKVK